MWGMDVSQTCNTFRCVVMPELVPVHGHPFQAMKRRCSCREFKQASYSTPKFKITPKSKWRHFTRIIVSVTRGLSVADDVMPLQIRPKLGERKREPVTNIANGSKTVQRVLISKAK